MTKRHLLIFAFLMYSAISFSQSYTIEKPDYDKIEKEISNEKSDFYYPRLMDKYLRGDTTMSLKEKRYLYYGYTFQKEYAPYSVPDLMNGLLDLLEKDRLSESELNEVVALSDSVLMEDPFDLKTLNFQLYALERLENPDKFFKRIVQMKIILDALLSSGDGLTKETAFYVISIAHEYVLLSVLGFEFDNEQRLIEHYDYLKVAKNPQKISGLYFDVSPCFKYMMDK